MTFIVHTSRNDLSRSVRGHFVTIVEVGTHLIVGTFRF